MKDFRSMQNSNQSIEKDTKIVESRFELLFHVWVSLISIRALIWIGVIFQFIRLIRLKFNRQLFFYVSNIIVCNFLCRFSNEINIAIKSMNLIFLLFHGNLTHHKYHYTIIISASYNFYMILMCVMMRYIRWKIEAKKIDCNYVQLYLTVMSQLTGNLWCDKCTK